MNTMKVATAPTTEKPTPAINSVVESLIKGQQSAVTGSVEVLASVTATEVITSAGEVVIFSQ